MKKTKLVSTGFLNEIILRVKKTAYGRYAYEFLALFGLALRSFITRYKIFNQLARKTDK